MFLTIRTSSGSLPLPALIFLSGSEGRPRSRSLQKRRVGHAFAFGPRAVVHVRRLDMAGPEDVEHALAGREQVVRDDAAVAAPPDGLRAHDGAALCMPDLEQAGEAMAEALAQRVVGVIMKARVLPEAVQLGRHIALAAAQAAELRDVLVA